MSTGIPRVGLSCHFLADIVWLTISTGGDTLSHPYVGRIWGIWESCYHIPKAVCYLLKGDYTLDLNPKPYILST